MRTFSPVVTTGLDFLIGLSLLQYLAILSWTGLVFYVAAALFAVSQGYLEVSSLIGTRRTRAYEPTYYDDEEPGDEGYGYAETHDEYYEETPYEDPRAGANWRREPRRYALG